MLKKFFVICLLIWGTAVLPRAHAGELEEISENLPSTPERIAKGKTMFMTTCMPCHGAEGKGDGPASVAFNPKPRNFTAEKFKQGSSPAAAFFTVTHGLGSMPSFVSIPAADRMALIHFVLSLSPYQTTDTPATLAKIGLDPSGKPLAGFEKEKLPELPVEFVMERMAVDGNVASLNMKEITQKMADDENADKQREAVKEKAAIVTPDLKRGETIFESCRICHGADAAGTALAQAPQLAGQDPDYLIAQLKKFQTGVRGAHPLDVDGLRMRPMSRMLRSEEDIVNVANYVSQLPPVSQPVTLGGNAAMGLPFFGTCAGCHGPDAKGMKATGAPALRYLQDWYALKQIQKFKAGIRGADSRDTNGATMRGIAAGVNDEQVKDIFSYINTLK